MHLWPGVSVQASAGGQPRARTSAAICPPANLSRHPQARWPAEVTLSCYVCMKLALAPVQDLGGPPALRHSPGIICRPTWLRARLAPSPAFSEYSICPVPAVLLLQVSRSHRSRDSPPQGAFFRVPSQPQLLNILKQIFNSVTGRLHCIWKNSGM